MPYTVFRLVFLILGFIAALELATTAAPFRYPEGEHKAGELRYISGLPVLSVSGSPEEIGEQVGVLATKPATKLMNYPRDCVRIVGLDFAWQGFVKVGKQLLENFPKDHLCEMEAIAKHSGINRDLIIAGNTLFDVKKFFGCSTLYISPECSRSGEPLLGRNLDFPTLGYLQNYTLVTVYHPEGKHAWASVGFPGAVGCLSGMNEKGLTVSVLEVYSTADGADKFDVKGTPYALCYRRILEECATVAEAKKLLEQMKRTTITNLAICDKKDAAIFEITNRSLQVRQPEHGMLPCTNHFRSPGLKTSTLCRRYKCLMQSKQQGQFGLQDVAEKLHEVNQGSLTLQTMVFEPAALKLHLAFGKCPSSQLPLKTLDLKPLFGVSGQ